MRRTPKNSVPQEETIQFSGAELAQLLACSVESTVVIPGSQYPSRPVAAVPEAAVYETDGGSFVGPVTFTLSHPEPVAPQRPNAASRIGLAFSLATIGILSGVLVGSSVSASAHAAGTAVGGGRQAQRRDRVSETTQLHVVPTQKAMPIPRKLRSLRGATRPNVQPEAPSVATVEVDNTNLSALGQAQLDRPF